MPSIENTQKKSATIAGPLPVRITVDGGISRVRLPNTDILGTALSYREYSFFPNSDGYLTRSVVAKLAYRQVDDHLEFATGCLQRVIQRLTRAGYEVTVNDLRSCWHDRVQIDASVLSDVEAIAPGLAEALSVQRQGVLECNDNRRSDILGCLCQLFRPAKIFVACKTVEAARSIAAGLGNYLGGEVEAVHGWDWQSSCRVVCGTFGSLNRSDPADWQILVFADAREGIQTTNNDARANYLHRRVYALDDLRKPRSPEEELRIEILAGSLVYRDPLLPLRRTNEFLAAFLSHASSGGKPSPNTRDRRLALWRDARRNQAIAEVALAFANGDETSLLRHELDLNEDDVAALGPQPGVVVIVDSMEHGNQMRGLLPGWRLFHGQPRNDQTSSHRIPVSVWGVPRNSIVTAVIADSLPCLDARAVIWASGGSVPFLPPVLGRSRQSLLLIDVWDDGNHLLAAETRQRLDTYRSLGCRVLGSNTVRREQCLIQQIESPDSNHHRNTSRRQRRSHRPSV